MRAELERLRSLGFVQQESTPKRRKSWFTLTDKGAALVPIATAYLQSVADWVDREDARDDAARKLHAAAPDLAEALKPFAAIASWLHDSEEDHAHLIGFGKHTLTFGDIRRAAAALKEAGVEP